MPDQSPDRFRVFPSMLGDLPTSEPMRVLHVDDEVALGELVKDYLEAMDDGFQIHLESDAKSAYDRFTSDASTFDCIVSDYQMPGMDGLELLRTVRRERPSFPFVLFTGKGSEEIAAEAISAGVTEYLQKGAGTDQFELLANRVKNIVEGYRAERRYRRLVQAMEWTREGVGLVTGAERFVYVNRSFADFLGYDRDELIGEDWSMLYPDGETDVLRDEVLPVISRTGRWVSEMSFVKRDGEEVPIDHALASIDDDMLVSLIQPVDGE